jgi:glycogen debranching enzyme
MYVGKNLFSYSYILAGKKAFFHRFADSTFRNKWCGFWAMPYKYIDYIACKVDGAWLNPESAVGCDYDGSRASHKYRVHDGFVDEVIFIPENRKSLALMIKSSKERDIEIEIAINIRKREENWHDRTYAQEGLTFKSDAGRITIKSMPTGEVVNSYCKDYQSGGVNERCLVVVYKLRGDEVNVSFDVDAAEEMTLHQDLKDKEKYYQALVRNKLISDSKLLVRGFEWSILNLEMLNHESSGNGYFGGYPWFTMFWGRDSGWVIPAIVDLGFFDKAKNALQFLADSSKNGQIPNYVLTSGEKDYVTIDATPLWIIAMHRYIMNSGDLTFLKKNESVLKSALKWCESREDAFGFLRHDDNCFETWVDTYSRAKKAVDVQALWIHSMECYSRLMELLKQKFTKNVALIKENFDKKFWCKNTNYYFDRIEPEAKAVTANAIVPLLFGIPNHAKEVLAAIESPALTTDWGVRSLSNKDPDYDPDSYHKGNVWGFLTGLAACAEFKYGENGMRYMQLLANNLENGCLGAMPEIYSGDIRKSGGCCMQAWNAALFIRAIDDYMLGIEVDAFRSKNPEDCITVDPKLPPGINHIHRVRRVKNSWVEIDLKKENDNLLTNITKV